MSIEIYALSDRALVSIAAWQRAIDREGFLLRLDRSRPLARLSGHLPAHRREQPAGFECDHWDPHDVMDTYDDIDFGRRWTHALAFRCGGDAFALWGAYAAAAAYARATGGIVFDPQAGEILLPERAVTLARDLEGSWGAG